MHVEANLRSIQRRNDPRVTCTVAAENVKSTRSAGWKLIVAEMPVALAVATLPTFTSISSAASVRSLLYWTGMDRGERTPSKIMDEQVICCWIDDPVGVDMRHKMNIDMICWECDYPHSDSSWPQSPEAVWKQMQASHCSDEDIDKMSHANAMRLYKFDPFSTLGGRENCNVGALRAQAGDWDVSIVARGIKATGTGALDLLNFAKADR